MTKGKKIIFIIMCVLAGVFAILFFGTLFFINVLTLPSEEMSKVEWFTSVSESGEHTVRVDKDESPAWPFGSQGIEIYADGELLAETAVANDGKQTGDDNYSIEWENDTAILCLIGEEQCDTYYEIKFDDVTEYETYTDSIGVEELQKISAEYTDEESGFLTGFDLKVIDENRWSLFVYDETGRETIISGDALKQIKTLLKKSGSVLGIVSQRASSGNGVRLYPLFEYGTENWWMEIDTIEDSSSNILHRYYFDSGSLPKTEKNLIDGIINIAFGQ